MELTRINRRLIELAAFFLRFSGCDLIWQKLAQPSGGICMLHRVCDDKASAFNPNGILSVTPQFFDKFCAWLANSQYDVITLDELPNRLNAGKSKRPFMVITFDDGYLDNVTNALPILEKYNLPFTVYVSSGLIAGEAPLWWLGLEWALEEATQIEFDFGDGLKSFDVSNLQQKSQMFDRMMCFVVSKVSEKDRAKLVTELCAQHGIDLLAKNHELMMSQEQLRRLAKHELCTIGAHTYNHFAIGRISRDDAKAEILADLDYIQSLCGTRPKHFCFPYGNPKAAGERDFALVAEMGFETAVTTRKGALFPDHSAHLTALPRLSINGKFQKMNFTKNWLGGLPSFIYNCCRKLDVKDRA